MGYVFTEPIWEHSGPQSWFFITLPHDVTDEIDELTEGRQRGFGSVRVQVTVGATTWATSIFPDTRAGSFVLPVKKAVRKAEGLTDGDPVTVDLELLDPA